MGKQELKQRETQVATGDGVGKQLEQTFTVDDNCLPSPQELAAYKSIDPRIVDYLINASVKEQAHRHKMDSNKLNLIRKADRRRWKNELVGNVFRISSYSCNDSSCWLCSLFRQTLVCWDYGC